mgnify:CR=1 FL=1
MSRQQRSEVARPWLATSQQSLSNLLDICQRDLPSKPALTQVAQDARQRLKRRLPDPAGKAQAKRQDELPGVWGFTHFDTRQSLGRRDQAGGGIQRLLRHGRMRVGKAKPP